MTITNTFAASSGVSGIGDDVQQALDVTAAVVVFAVGGDDNTIIAVNYCVII